MLVIINKHITAKLLSMTGPDRNTNSSPEKARALTIRMLCVLSRSRACGTGFDNNFLYDQVNFFTAPNDEQITAVRHYFMNNSEQTSSLLQWFTTFFSDDIDICGRRIYNIYIIIIQSLHRQ